MKKILLTVIVMLAIFAGSILLYIFSGSYDVSQLTPHNSLTKWMINKTRHSSIHNRMEAITVPPDLNDTAVLALGFQHYDEMCACCHGAPGIKAWEMAAGLYPKPPEIYKSGKEEDPREFFWVIKNGIKMTSMPAYGPTHDDVRLWAMTAFVTKKLPKMTAAEYREWKEEYTGKEDDEGIERQDND